MRLRGDRDRPGLSTLRTGRPQRPDETQGHEAGPTPRGSSTPVSVAAGSVRLRPARRGRVGVELLVAAYHLGHFREAVATSVLAQHDDQGAAELHIGLGEYLMTVWTDPLRINESLGDPPRER
jgi:hypothetical protein